jgi:hypothetical protein
LRRLVKVKPYLNLVQFRKVIDSKPKTAVKRDNLFNKQAFIKKLVDAPLNVTENTQSNYASLLLSHIRSRNQETMYRPVEAMPQTNIVKITYSKKLTYGTKRTDSKPGVCASVMNDTLYRTNRTGSSNSKPKMLGSVSKGTNPLSLLGVAKTR